jgi:hypothetical protein
LHGRRNEDCSVAQKLARSRYPDASHHSHFGLSYISFYNILILLFIGPIQQSLCQV